MANRIEEKIQEELNAISNEEGKVDIEMLRERNTPLATVINEFVMSKTARDVHGPILSDVMKAIDERNDIDSDSDFNKALNDLSKE